MTDISFDIFQETPAHRQSISKPYGSSSASASRQPITNAGRVAAGVTVDDDTDDKDAKRAALKEALATTTLDNTTDFAGDLSAFAKHIASPACDAMTQHPKFNPLMEVKVLDGDGDNPDNENMIAKADSLVTVKFVSGVPGKWNYTETLKHRDFLKWKLRMRKLGFSVE